MKSIYTALFQICTQSAFTLIITLIDEEPYLIPSQIPRNDDKKVKNNNNNTPRKHTVQLLVKHSETSILIIS